MRTVGLRRCPPLHRSTGNRRKNTPDTWTFLQAHCHGAMEEAIGWLQQCDAGSNRDHHAGRQPAVYGPDHRGNGHGERSGRAIHPSWPATDPPPEWSPSIAPPFPSICSKPNYSVTPRAHSRERSARVSDCLSRRMAARSSWMRSARCLCLCSQTAAGAPGARNSTHRQLGAARPGRSSDCRDPTPICLKP